MRIHRLKSTHGLWAILASILLGSVSTTRTASAQRDSLPWFTRRDMLAGLGALLATAAVAPFDKDISAEFTDPVWRRGSDLQSTAGEFAILGGSGPFMASGVLYAVGSSGHFPGLTRFALHNIEAVALGGGIAGLIRGFSGRALPNVTTREEFSFGRGFHDNNGPFVSFPSGHTTAAFAMAATISGEVSRSLPALAPFATPAAFTLATAVGFARVAQRVHWPTDLPLAMAIGTWSGEAVQTHAGQGGLFAWGLRGLAIAPMPDGRTLIGWSLRASDESRLH